MPKVSIVIPVYGVEKYIERCARSLFEQTLDDIEYLFIDDCTPDKSIEVLKRVLDEYPNRKDQVIIHRMEQNSGQAAVRKWGILNATGEYIIHCDSDDWADVTMYESLYRKAKEEDADVVVCEHFDTDGVNHKPSKHVFKDDKLYLMFNFPTLWEKLVKRSLFTNNEIEFPSGNMGEDKAISIQLLWFAKSWTYICQPLYYYYINPQSISNIMTKQKVLERFEMARINIVIVETFIEQKHIKGADHYVDIMKKRCVDWLISALPDRELLDMYRHTFKGLPFRILTNRIIPIKEKLHYYLLYIGLMNN